MLSNTKIWQLFLEQSQALGPAPEPLKRTAVEPFPMTEYAPVLGLQLAETLTDNATGSGEFWSWFVGYDKREDLERIAIPGIMSHLQDFLVDDQVDSLFHASAELMQYIAREMIRRGQLPVLYKAHLAAAEPAEPAEFRLVG